jgi:L-arabinose isomerase
MDGADWAMWAGSKVVDIPAAEFAETYNRQAAKAVNGRVADISATHPIHDLSEDELSRSARLSLALDDIVAHYKLDGGAFNCHGENCLQNPQIGISACYAISRQTTAGRPFSCTGDLPTAIALVILKHISGSATYGELDFVDPGANAVVIANGGEGDFTNAIAAVHVSGNENFAGLHGSGASPEVRLQTGKATLLSFTPIDSEQRYRIVVGAGHLIDVPINGLRVFHHAFRFQGIEAARAFEQWCDAGAVHHLALAQGDWTGELKLIAEMMKFEYFQVGATSCD